MADPCCDTCAAFGIPACDVCGDPVLDRAGAVCVWCRVAA
jgi:hypothetical protein